MNAKQRELARGMIVAGLLIALAVAAVAARRLGLLPDPEVAPRLFGIACGLVLAAYGNVIPRRLVGYEPESNRPARRQASLRFSGWAFVLAGLASALIWAFAPSAGMALWSTVPVLAAIALVVLRCLRSRMERTEA